MQLEKILNGINYQLLQGSLDISVNDIKYDSRKVNPGDLYVAIKGFNSDGHDYIPEAISKKASVIVVSKILSIHGTSTIIKVDDTRLALAYMSKNYFDNPASKLLTIAVTGTSGKTTTSHIIKEILENASIKCGLIGSIGIKYNDIEIPTKNTTPESYDIEKTLHDMVSSGITHVVLEASSQAFKLNRLAGLTFDYGLLTNITPDHISPTEHENLEDYISCKNKLFLNSKEIIINNDSLHLEEVLKGVKVPQYTYALKNEADLKGDNITLINEENFFGSSFTTSGILNDTFKLSLPGTFNIYNALCAILTCTKLKIPSDTIKKALLNLKVRGRMETALITPKYKVIIDYAHTEEALKSLVETIKTYNPSRLISVFGGGGNRAKERRYNLGTIIGKNSDLCIITMDNPRFEEISAINEDIKEGLNKVNAKYITIDDRASAIKYACSIATDNDLILLIGKGHEEYQDIKGTKYPFNELEILKEIENDLK